MQLRTVEDKEREKYLKLTQQQQIIESILKDEEAGLTESKKNWMKMELDKLIADKRKNFLPEDAMITNEHLANLKLGPKQIQKLILQHPSPAKYSNFKHNMLNAVIQQENY